MNRLALVLVLVFLPCQSAFAQNPETQKANEFFENAFTELMMRSPTFQSRLGIKQDYDKWDDLSDEFARATHHIRKRQLNDLRQTINYEELGPQGKLSRDLFVYEAERHIRNFDYRFHNYPVNQMRGWQSQVPAFLINYHKIESVTDAEAYIARLGNVELLFTQLIESLQLRAKIGIIPPKFVFPYAISDSRNVITGAPFDDSGDDSTIFADFKKKVNALDIGDADKETLIGAAAGTLIEVVKPAYQGLAAYLEELERDATTDDGVWKFPEGAAFYSSRLQWMTTTDMTADEIHELGLAEVARIHGEMRVIMRKVEYEGDLREFFDFMREDLQFYLGETADGREQYMVRATEMIETMRGRLDELFGIKPKADLVVKRVEPFREKSTGKAFYQRPSPDGSRPGVYYANLYLMSDMPTYQMEALAFHEGIPGHHMQLAIAQELEGLPRFRKYASFTAYIEGWGLYSEYIPKEIGFYQDPYSDFGRLAMELWRACRLVVDTGMHHQRWTRERAIAYLDENTPNPHGDVVKAIERYVVMPGQATAYKIGMIKILELRTNARERLGERFDIRAFHDVVLKNGPVPLSVLEQLVEEWITSSLGS